MIVSLTGLLIATTTPFASAASRPDLVVSAVAIGTSSVDPGLSLPITDTVKNVGRARAGGSVTSYWLSKDKVKGSTDRLLVGSRSVPRLRPGRSSKGTKATVVPGTTPAGSYFVIACADATRKVRESKEGNNCRSSTARVAVNDVIAPAKPTFIETIPESPANNIQPSIIGTAERSSTVKLYESAVCDGDAVAEGTAGSTGTFGIPVTVTNNSTTTFYATATDAAANASPCSDPITYVEDSHAPGGPTVTATDPASPANDNEPAELGSAEPGSRVAIYTNANCAGTPIERGPAGEDGSFSVPGPVPDDATGFLLRVRYRRRRA